jgi:UDP-N-acetyl-D-mannosaminuronate dehydrogenase
MPEYVVERLMKLLNAKKKCLNGSRILMLGIAYKGDIDDMRESPALKVLDSLEKFHACVEVVDPYIPSFTWKGETRETVQLTEERLKQSDAVVITTAHRKGIDYAMVCKEAVLVFDTKNILKNLSGDKSRVHVL